ncbi:MAG: OmpP1/FadL family transporter [Planctomycetota bacterium]|jgi:long-subunit fatty acid transport protein
MRHLAILPLVIAAALALAPYVWAEGFRAPPPGPEAAGRAGADLAVATESSALKSNPAGLAWTRRNRSDVSLTGLFSKIDFEAGSSGTGFNGDQALFGVNWAYAFIPSQLITDPFREWSLVKHKALETFTSRSRYSGRMTAPIQGTPGKLELRGEGTGFWVSDLVLRATVKGDQTRIRFGLPVIEPLPPERPVQECTIEFEYRLSAKGPFRAPSLTLTAYGQNESALLKGEAGKWHTGKINLLVSTTALPPGVFLTSVSEEALVELRKVVFLRIYGQSGRKNEARTPVADEEIDAEVDTGSSKIILATAPGPFRAVSREDVLWALTEAERFRGQELASLELEFRYGFEGGGAKGKLSLLVDGKNVARKSFSPKPEVAPAGDEMARRRRAVDWMDREKIHLGVGFFTDAFIGSGYNNLPSDAGEHEGQLRYGMYSATIGGAIEVHPAVALGASVDLSHGRFFNFDGLFSQPVVAILRDLAPTYIAQTGKDRVSLQIDSNNLYAWGGAARFGILARPMETMAVGLTFQTPVFTGRYTGKAHVDLTDDFDFSGFDSWIQSNLSLPLAGNYGYDGEYDAYITGFRMPMRAGVGLSYRLADKITFALDGEFVGWSKALERMTIKFTRGSNPDSDALTGNTFKARLPFRFVDQWTFALGVSAQLHEKITVHAGYRWARSPVKESSAHPLFPAHVENFVSLGLTLRHRTIAVHLSVQHGFDAELDINTSSHGPLFDGSSLTLRQETASVGFSYEY